jgi:O-antigen/teichoic acid export membrane protein
VVSNALGDLFVVPSSTIRIRRMPWLFAGYSLASFVCTVGLGVWFVVIQNQGLRGYLTASIIAAALTALFGAFVMLGVSRPCLTAPGLLAAFRFALPAVPSSLVSTAGSVLDRFLLNYFANLETLGLYSVSMKFVDLISGGIHPSLKMTFGPFMMKQYAENKDTGKDTVASITPFYLLPYFAAGLGLIYFIDPFVRLVDRPAYFGVATWVPWLVGIAILSNLYFYYTNGMFLANRTDLLFMPAVVQLGTLAIACAVLIPPYQLVGLVASRYLSAIAFLGLSLYLSQKVFPLPHKWGALIALASASVGFALVDPLLELDNLYLEAALKLPVLLSFLFGAYFLLARETRSRVSQP